MRLLDLYCGEGGAAEGYRRAGWTVDGVDTDAEAGLRYLTVGRFIHDDALGYLHRHHHEYDAVTGSPPCQPYSITRYSHYANPDKHPDLLAATREAVHATGLPYIIENVPGAPVMTGALTLCGTGFGLTATDDDGTPLYLQRHRRFESNLALTGPGCRCRIYRRRGWTCAGSYGGGAYDRRTLDMPGRGGYTPPKHIREQLMGITWMTLDGLAQAVPPAYTQHLGRQLKVAATARTRAH